MRVFWQSVQVVKSNVSSIHFDDQLIDYTVTSADPVQKCII